jgi:hypothetical protein
MEKRRLRSPGVACLALAVTLAMGGQASAHASAASERISSQRTASAPTVKAAAAATAPSVTAGAATMVGQLSGEPTAGIPQLNNTGSTASFYGGDLGTMWSDPSGDTRVAYGDSLTQYFAPSSGASSATGGHICNAVFTSNTPAANLSGGMALSTPTGANTPTRIAPCGSNGNNLGTSIVPIGGVYVNGADYVKLTTITNLATGAGNGSYVVKSTDGGRSWASVPGLSWAYTGSEVNFQYTSYANRDGYVYAFSTHVGRDGPLYLSRVPAGQFETKSDYQYWNGLDWVANDAGVAVPVIAGTVGEPSVQFDQALGLWLTTYLDSGRGSIVLRYATSPAGPWSGEQIVYQNASSSAGTGGIYGGFMHPGANATDLYINVSEWYPYQVYLLHVPLAAGSKPLNLVSDGDFADPMAGAANTNQGDPGVFGWSVLGYGKVDVGLGNGYQSPNEGYLYSSTASFIDLYQTVAVQPYHDYTYKAWVRTSGTANTVYVGVRNMAQTVHWENGPIGPLNGYTQETVTFDSGANSQVQVYAGTWVAAGVTTWLQLGQAQLVQDAALGDGGFENQSTNTVALPWHVENLTGNWTGWVGIDVNQGWAQSGANNAYIRTDTRDWNAIKQLVPVQPNTTYTLTGWFRTSATFGTGYFGVRGDITSQPLKEVPFGGLGGWTQQSVTLNSGANDFLTVYAGYWAPGSDSWLQIDGISLT